MISVEGIFFINLHRIFNDIEPTTIAMAFMGLECGEDSKSMQKSHYEFSKLSKDLNGHELVRLLA